MMIREFNSNIFAQMKDFCDFIFSFNCLVCQVSISPVVNKNCEITLSVN